MSFLVKCSRNNGRDKKSLFLFITLVYHNFNLSFSLDVAPLLCLTWFLLRNSNDVNLDVTEDNSPNKAA